tara:strand:+ start:313 stop:753 length:441 start_codon:yes stop_codon:yes gene_type:complete
MDIFTPDKRSEIMSKIAGKNTKPEILVRSLLHSMGFRFRLHRKDLPGKPDICLPKYKTVIFVNGCYWHRHKLCKKGQSFPASNKEFWKDKFSRTKKRDKKNHKKACEMGWRVIIVWECETSDLEHLSKRLRSEICNTKQCTEFIAT